MRKRELFLLAGLFISLIFMNGLVNAIDISTCQQLQNMRTNLNADYYLKNDIDCSGIANFEPIGTKANPFSGSLNGNMYSIKNLKISRPSQNYVGLIGYLGTPFYGDKIIISGVNLVNANVEGKDYVGAIVGYSNSFSSGVYRSSVSGSVNGNKYVGGIVGYAKENNVKLVSSRGSVSGASYVGGLMGYGYGSDIGLSYSFSSVNGGSYTGGLAGYFRGTSSDWYAHICGSYSAGLVTSSSNMYSGAIFGKKHGSYVSICSDYLVLFDNQRSGKTTACGSGTCTEILSKTTAEMKQRSVYGSYWDFNSVWQSNSNYNGGYPYFLHQVCSFSYTPWSDCLNGVKTRSITSSFPYGCFGGTKVLSASCSECTNNVYSDWGRCNATGQQNKTLISKEPAGCESSPPSVLVQDCPACMSFEYSDWGVCDNEGNKDRSMLSTFPENCFGGEDPILSKPCNDNLFWLNLYGDEIESSYPGSSVILEFDEYVGSEVNYTILKGTAEIKTGVSSEGYVLFEFSESATLGNYSFKIKNGTSEGLVSPNNLTLLAKTELADSEIELNHVNDFITLANKEVSFELDNTGNENYLIDLELDFGDNNKTNITNYFYYGRESDELEHKYANSGSYLLRFLAKEKSSRNQQVYLTKNMRVLKEGINIFPIIDSPVSDSINPANWVKFKASSFEVYNCTVKGSSDCVSGFENIEDILCCKNELWSIDENIINQKKLFVGWDLGYGLHINGTLNSTNKNQLLNFTGYVPRSGLQKVKLTMKYPFVGSENVEGYSHVSFIAGSNEYECVSTASSAYWKKLTSINDIFWVYKNSNEQPKNMCNNKTYMGNDSWCCPRDMVCLDGKCEVSDIGLVSCIDFKTNESCNNANGKFAEGFFNLLPPETYQGICKPEGTFEQYLGPTEVLCSRVVSCACDWNSEKKLCEPALLRESICEGDEESTKSYCKWTEASREDYCGEERGEIVLKFQASVIGDAGSFLEGECEDIQMPYPCSKSVQLSFFNIWSFILVGLIILGVYLGFDFYRKKKN